MPRKPSNTLGGNGPRVSPAPGVVGHVKEADLAKRLGTNKQWIRKFRNEKLDEGTEWFHEGRGAKTRVWWTMAALGKIEKTLGIKGLTVEKAQAEELTVLRSGFTNKRVIECQRKSGEVVIVKVKDSANYTRQLTTGQPMVVMAMKDSDGPCYHVVGRAPRWKGRW